MSVALFAVHKLIALVGRSFPLAPRAAFVGAT
jgi:hypothetical protein